MKRISIDIDGVLARFTGDGGLIQPIANRLWPGIMPEEYQPPDWDHTDIFTKQHWNVLWSEIRNTEDFWEQAKPYEENMTALRGFLMSGPKDLFFVTSRASTAGATVQKQTYDWMYGQGIPVAGLWNYSAIVPVPSSKNKKIVMEALEITHSVDDLGPTVEACNQIPGHTAFVLDRPWNRDKEYGPRVYSLKEFFDKVEAN